MKSFIISITLATDDAGTTITRYFTDGDGFATLPTDNPANTYIEPRVTNAGNIMRELFSGNFTFGAVRPSFGEITLANSDGALDDWISYGIDGHPISIWYGEGAFPSEYMQVLKVYGFGITAGFNAIKIRLRDRLQLMDKPFCNTTFAGTGGLEGDSDMAGRVKPRTCSTAGWFPIIIVSASSLLYFVTTSGTAGMGSFFQLFEGGVEITRGADYTSGADCLASSPSAGQCRFWFGVGGNGPVYVRLGSVPAYDLRCFGNGYANYYIGATSIWLAYECGILDAITSQPYPARYVDDPSVTYLEIAEEAAKRDSIFFGMTNTDTFQATLFASPSLTPSYTFTRHNASDFVREPPAGMEAPISRLTYNAGETWPCQVVGSAGASMRDQLSRKISWSFSVDNLSVLAKHPSAPALSVDDKNRSISNYLDVSIITAKYLTLFGVQRDFVSLSVHLDEATLALDLHATVQVKINRFGWDAGKNFRIISIRADYAARKIQFGLWG